MTGGEPLVRPDVVEIARTLAKTDGIRDIGLTTNGMLLEKLAPALADAGLSRVNVSLDTLNPQTFRPLRPCLIQTGEVPVREALRAGQDVTALIEVAVSRKPEGHQLAQRDTAPSHNRMMCQIGG